jgi:hypothetical protein
MYASNKDHSSEAVRHGALDRPLRSVPPFGATADQQRCFRMMVMKVFAQFGLLSGLLLLTSCATNRDSWLVPRQVQVLRHRSTWPQVRAVAQHELAIRKGDPEFARDAFYRPIEYADGVWFVTVSGVMYYQDHYASFIRGCGVSGGYPRSMSWDAYDLRIRDNGEVLSYASRRETQYDAGWVYP